MLRDVEDALRQIFLFHLTDQDRAIAIIEDPTVEDWLTEPGFGALFVNANSRRDEAISPASVACAMIIHLFTNTVTKNRVPITTLYWFCGLHKNGPNDNASSLVRSLICQLLSASAFGHGFEQIEAFDKDDLGELLEIFTKLLRQLPKENAVICVLDGISYYEDFRLRDDTCRVIGRLVELSRGVAPIFKVFVTSPTRMTHTQNESIVKKHTILIDIAQHVTGAKQGFNHRAMVMATEQKLRKFSKNLPTN